MMNTTSQYGYHRGLRQQGLYVEARIPTTSSFDLDGLDHWLIDSWGVSDLPKPTQLFEGPVMGSGDLSPSSKGSQYIVRLASRIVILYKELMHAAYLPCVTLGRICEIEISADAYRIKFLLPVVCGYSKEVYGGLLDAAIQLALNQTKAIPELSAGQNFFDLLDKRISGYRRLMPDGVTNAFIAQLAHKLGYPFMHLGFGLFQIGYGSKSLVIQRSSCLLDSALGAQLVGNKLKTAELLRNSGFPVPEHAKVDNEKQAIEVVRKMAWPIVVKPADRERSEGVTINIDSEDKLIQAFRLAKTLSNNILVERQVPGNNHRIFVANGRLVYALKRYPKCVTGDGLRTVSELVHAHNYEELKKPTWRRKKLIDLDQEAMDCLARDGMSLDRVLPKDQRAFVRQVGSDQWGSDRDIVTNTIHPDNVDLAVRAARLFGLTVCGVDLMTTDISQPWHQNGAIINEINFKPLFGGDLTNDKTHPYLESLLPLGGKIPVHVLLGDGDLWAEARGLGVKLSRMEPEVILVGSTHAEYADGRPFHLSCVGLFARCRALLRNQSLHALVVVLDSEEFKLSGLPFEYVSEVIVTGGLSATTQKILHMLEAALPNNGPAVK